MKRFLFSKPIKFPSNNLHDVERLASTIERVALSQSRRQYSQLEADGPSSDRLVWRQHQQHHLRAES